MKLKISLSSGNQYRLPHRIILALLLSVFIIGTTGCKQDVTSESSLYDSGYDVITAQDNQTYWIDNNKVIFFSSEQTTDDSHSKKAIYIWDINTGKVRQYAELGDSTKSFCYADNVLSYYVGHKQEGDRTLHSYMEGPLGQEKLKSYSKKYSKSQINPFTCQPSIPLGVNVPRWGPLKPEHGYMIRLQAMDKTLYYLKTDGERIQIPLDKLSYKVDAFYPFKNAYYLTTMIASNIGIIKDKEKAKCRIKSYWIFPDGQVEKICISAQNEWNRGSIQTYPVKIGSILLLHTIKSYGDTGEHGGAYLISNNKTEKILNGRVGGLSVSADGCKIAFAHILDNIPMITTEGRLKVFNICK